MDLDLWDFLEVKTLLVFPFQNNLKDLDPSFKMDLDLWDFLEVKNLFYSWITQDWFIHLL